MWEVEYTDEFGVWWELLSPEDQELVRAGVELIQDRGPALGRPAVDTLEGSRHKNMKELRTGTIRVLFAFDPRRTAILLLGGDKRGEWAEWYERSISDADRLYDEHLAELRREGEI